MREDVTQPRPLAQRVARPRLHQRLEHPTVHILDRRRALAEILERLERTIRFTQSDDRFHGV